MRTTRETVTFDRPSHWRLSTRCSRWQYTIAVDEELLEGLSFLAYRRVATTIYLPLHPGGGAGSVQAVTVDPEARPQLTP